MEYFATTKETHTSSDVREVGNLFTNCTVHTVMIRLYSFMTGEWLPSSPPTPLPPDLTLPVIWTSKLFFKEGYFLGLNSYEGGKI